MNFTQEILSKLGTEPEPFGWSDIFTLAVLFLLLAMIAGIEFLIGHAVRRIAARAWRSISSEFDRANRKTRNDN